MAWKYHKSYLSYSIRKNLTTLADLASPSGLVTCAEEEMADVFGRENVSENHRSWWIVHSIGVFVINVIGNVTIPITESMVFENKNYPHLNSH